MAIQLAFNIQYRLLLMSDTFSDGALNGNFTLETSTKATNANTEATGKTTFILKT